MHNEFIGIEVNVKLLDSQPKVPELEHRQIFQNLFSFFKTSVATLTLARDQGKGVARCEPNSRPGSAIV
jgi:hypothetical protein